MIQEIIQKLKSAPANSKLYLGADSVRFKKGKDAFAKVTVVGVIHLAGSKGCQVVGKTSTHQIYDKNLAKPQHRMLTEVQALVDTYILLEDALVEHNMVNVDIEVHLDIASDEQFGSNCAAKAAAGYVLGLCGVSPVLKPNAWAASTAADLFPKKLGKITC